jgi:hypothetical protein
MLRKTSAAAAVIAFATAGSALFGGAALAASPSVDCGRLIDVDASVGLLGQGGTAEDCKATGISSTSTSVVDRGEVEDD